jgi:hypothetical protein
MISPIEHGVGKILYRSEVTNEFYMGLIEEGKSSVGDGGTGKYGIGDF